MTFREFVEKINEVYQKKKRYFGKRPVMVSRGGVMCKISDISFDRGAVVMTDGEAYLETVDDMILRELERMNRLKAMEIGLEYPESTQAVEEIMEDE